MKLSIRQVVITFGVLFIVQMSQAYFNAPSLTASELKDLIVSEKVKTVDQLLPLLPEVMRKNPVLAYNSHALNLHLISPLTPRVILFNEDASLILAFTKNPGESTIQAGKDSLEVIAFNNRTAKYELQDIVFDGNKIPFVHTQPETNPALCLKCHGQNPRPIFQDYNAWAGFYGSFSQNGVSAKGTAEYENLKKFLAAKSEMPRYKEIDTSHFKEGEIGISSASSQYLFAPVTAFGMGLQKNMEYRLAKKVLSHPMYPKLKNFIAYLGSDLSTCAPIRQRVTEIYDAVFSQESRKAKAQKILEAIRRRLTKDIEFKKSEFEKNNIAHAKADPRGVISLFANTLLNQEKDPYYTQSREALEKQLVLFSLFADSLGLTSEDLSTFPMAPSIGVVHILRLGLYSDEQMFLGLSQVMLQINPFSLPRIENSCAFPESAVRLKQRAIDEGLTLKLEETSTMFEPMVRKGQ